MKKFKTIFCCLIMLVFPMLVFTGCGETFSYTISMKSSNSSRGTVTGASLSPLTEGTEVNLLATPSSGAKFMCWIKDNQKIVSKTQNYTVISSKDSQGMYTALFDEKSDSAMMYSAMSKVTLSVDGQLASYNIIVNHSPSTSIDIKSNIFTGEVKNSSTIETFNGNVFSFLQESSYLFDIQVNYSLIGSEGISQSFPKDKIEVKGASFENGAYEYTYVYQDINDKEVKLTMNFVKLNLEIINNYQI